MKHLLRLTIVLFISLLGELLAALIPLPVPGSIYGMVLMLAALLAGVVKLETVRGVGKFLIDVMPVLFVPAAVGLMDSWPALQTMLLPCLIALLPITLIVMAVSGLTTQAVLRHGEKEGGHAGNHR